MEPERILRRHDPPRRGVPAKRHPTAFQMDATEPAIDAERLDTIETSAERLAAGVGEPCAFPVDSDERPVPCRQGVQSVEERGVPKEKRILAIVMGRCEQILQG